MAKDFPMDTQNAVGSHADAVVGQILAEYLNDLKAIRNTGAGVPETSYYPALSNLFNAVGKSLKPRVRCVINIGNRGAGLPDGGLFTADQFSGELRKGQLPSRGAIEVKGTAQELLAIAASQQVRDYLSRYGLVIITNLRSFSVIAADDGGGPEPLETFDLANNEQDFWNRVAAHPRAAAQARGGQFMEFIRRVCLHNAPLSSPKDVAWFLASYARDALVRVERQKELPALQAIRTALEEALGMNFIGEKGEHFFRSTLVQTLFYGVFSAWVRWHRDSPAPGAKFEWQTAEWSLHIPFIGTLYGEVARPKRLQPLQLVELLDWSAGVLNRVDRRAFFRDFDDEHAVQYFYEPFLEAYDPELRKELGVWYTPREIVRYQVARVDRVLRDELNLTDGLADPNVVVLDPCCGTGAYLVEVLRTIAATLHERGGDALVASDLKRAAMTRVFGFEIMPAPFVISHLQLGLTLQGHGARLSQRKGERVGVYLTNALTGWEPPKGTKAQLMFPYPELREERDAAERVKRGSKILVILGNPPYNAFAGVSPQEEQGLVEPYKGVYYTEGKLGGTSKKAAARRIRRYRLSDPISKGGWGIRKFNLDDLYVRFFRLAERRIAEMSGQGVVSFISNHSWISEPSFVVLREHLLKSFDKFWIENLHGNRKISEYAPDGRTSETVFAISGYSVGIQQGVATSLWVKRGTQGRGGADVLFRNDIADAKAGKRRQQLLGSLETEKFDDAYTRATPCRENRLSFRPEQVAAHYTKWPRIVDLAQAAPQNGLMEKRGGALTDIDRVPLEDRMRDYFDAALSWDDYKTRHTALVRGAAGFSPKQARLTAAAAEGYDAGRLHRYAMRPFDTRWCYYTQVNPLWNRARPALWRQYGPGNAFLLVRPAGVANPEGAPVSFTRCIGDNDYQRGHAYFIAWRTVPRTSVAGGGGLFGGGQREANFSTAARRYLTKLGISDPDADPKHAGILWLHALAIGYSPQYLNENADGIRRDWPRIPLPLNREALEASAALGERVAALLDTESAVEGVTAGKISPLLKAIGSIAKVGGGSLDPSARDLEISAGWGHHGKKGVVMPAQGKSLERGYDPGEAAVIAAEAAASGIAASEIRRLLGEKTTDVYLNGVACWRNIPLNVWEYYIGGYQVIKKWLSYREHKILGRALKPEEAREVTEITRRITAIILLQPRLDENYQTVKAAPFDWPAKQ